MVVNGFVLNNNTSERCPHRRFDYLLVPQQRRLAPFRSDQHVNVLDLRTTVQQFPDEHFAHEARATRDEHGSAMEKLGDFTLPHVESDLWTQTVYDDWRVEVGEYVTQSVTFLTGS